MRESRKLYDVDPDSLGDAADVESLTMADTRIEEERIVANYTENDVPDGENNYSYLIRSLRPFTPFTLPAQPELSIANLYVKTPMAGVVNNLDDFYCSVARNDSVTRKRFYLQNYIRGESTIESQRIPSGDVIETKIYHAFGRNEHFFVALLQNLHLYFQVLTFLAQAL